MLNIISIIALSASLTMSVYADTETPVTQLMNDQADTSAEETAEVEYIEWTFE